MKAIQTIIRKLGYEKSEKLFKIQDINKCEGLSWHDKRVLNELRPYAVYVADGNVLVAFFENIHMRENADIQCKIWNAQIPVIISDEGSWVKIYNGKNMSISSTKNMQLFNIANYEIEKCDEKNNFSYWNVTNKMMLKTYEDSLGKKNLNDFLIENLRFITQQLKDKYQVSFANKLVLRVLFIRYLIDRGINIGYKGLNDNIKESQEVFLDIVKQKDELFALFKYLKNKFNGNLFELDEQKERQEISDESLTLLYNFLTAKVEMKTGQLCLFPFYDFNIIPIELISNIYEILLGKEKQDKDKAFYTPEYLADYIIERTVGTYLYEEKECTVLDPSCGSGIFLVKSLRKILERNASDNGYIQNKKVINRLIKSNIFGVDFNEEAVDVTIFSLYITLFDYQDPKSLKDFRLPLLKGENIIFGDFFDEEIIKPIRNVDFKFIIGNPPWGSVEQDLYRKYCEEKNIILQNKEICVAFLLKVQEIGSIDTECSLVIPSKILYKGKKPSQDFRKKMLLDVEIQQVLEISAVRKQIFKGAIAPAAVLSFICKKACKEHKIEYISLKPNKYLKLFGVIMIEPDDIKYVEQDLLIRQDGLWKILVYGSYWDYELLNSMTRIMPTIADIEEEEQLKHGKGIQDHRGEGKDSSHLIGRKMLSSDGCIEHFKLNLDNLTTFNKSKINRPRKKELFEPPYVFFKKGLDCSDYSIRAVFTEDKLVYKEAVNCIKGTEENKKILLNLTGLLNSSVFTYFNLMLGSSVGIEREQVFLKELEKFPYAYSDELVRLVEKIQLQAQKSNYNEELKNQLDRCVLKMYGLQDNYFVDYALNVQIPILCGNYVEEKCNSVIMEKYAHIFIDTWNKRLERSGIYYSINLYPNIKGKFAAFEMKLLLEERNNSINVIEDVDDDVELLTTFMIYKLNDCFYQTKNVAELEDDTIVIVKTIDFKNWHPAMAIKDSYRVLNTVLLGEEDCK